MPESREEYGGVVVNVVVGRVEQGDYWVGGEGGAEGCKCRIGKEFGPVFCREFIPAVERVGVKPFTKLGGGRYIFVPEIIMKSSMRQAAWP